MSPPISYNVLGHLLYYIWLTVDVFSELGLPSENGSYMVSKMETTNLKKSTPCWVPFAKFLLLMTKQKILLFAHSEFYCLQNKCKELYSTFGGFKSQPNFLSQYGYANDFYYPPPCASWFCLFVKFSKLF